MRKLGFWGLIFILLGCAGCGVPANSPPAREAFYLIAGDVKLSMNAPAAPALEALAAGVGAPLGSFESPSCAVDAVDTTYRYPGFELTVTAPARGAPYLSGLKLTDDTYATPEGLAIGSAEAAVQEALGGAPDGGFYSCARAGATLQVHVSGGLVDQILLGTEQG